MARCFSLALPLSGMSHVFNIDASVGKNGVNKREDVFLVQYLLKVWLATEKDTPKLLPFLAKTPDVKMDGICGDKTKAVINTFEIFHTSNNFRNNGLITPLFQTDSGNKLFLLNELFSFAGGLRGKIEVIPGNFIPFPNEIRKLLYLF